MLVGGGITFGRGSDGMWWQAGRFDGFGGVTRRVNGTGDLIAGTANTSRLTVSVHT